jgi:transposase InsO family protein
MRTFLTRALPPLRLSLRHFHSDGGSELIGEQVRSLLREKGVSTSHTPRDTPEMNSLLERKVREIKQRVSCMLLHSGLPLPFWWMAWKTATQLQLYTPTPTFKGYLTPHEGVHGVPPDLRSGCAYGAPKPMR